MITRAVVLAHRLAIESRDQLAPTAVALVRQHLELLVKMGFTDIAVVDGRHSELLRQQLAVEDFRSANISVLPNISWKNKNGSAILVAKDVSTRGSYLVVSGDKALSPASLEALLAQPVDQDMGGAHLLASVLLVPSTEREWNDVRVKVSKASVPNGSANTNHSLFVSEIRQDLEDYDMLFSGHAVLSAQVTEQLATHANPSLEAVLASLCSQAAVGAVVSPDLRWEAEAQKPVDESVSAILDAKQHPKYMLLNPGPVNTTAAVKSAMVHHDVCHRDSNFSELMVSLTDKLLRVYRGTSQHTVLPLTGSGTAAMECAIASTVPEDKKILIVNNGAFGERLVEVADLHRMNIVELKYAWGEVVRAADIEKALQADPEIAVVAMTYHETSVGLLAPVTEIGAMCRAHDKILIVDAVSALGAEDIDVERDNIDICYGSANKCLHAIAGAAFLCVSNRVWDRIEKIRPRSYYLDLKRYRKYMDQLAQTPFTPAVSAYFALDAACAEFLADGHTKRFTDYKNRNSILRNGLSDLGMKPFTHTGVESNSVVTCGVPAGIKFDDLYDAMKDRGIIIYACKSVLADKFMQIANMGDLDEDDIRHFLGILEMEIERLREVAAAPMTSQHDMPAITASIAAKA